MRRKYEDNIENDSGWMWYLIITILLILVVLSIRSLEKKNKENSDAVISKLQDITSFYNTTEGYIAEWLKSQNFRGFGRQM